jgi:hypothetical protein
VSGTLSTVPGSQNCPAEIINLFFHISPNYL